MSKLLKSKFLLGVVTLAIAFVVTTSALAADGSVTMTLKKGMKNVQVKYLQQMLNEKGFTVATSGAGSVGKETSTFGPATVAAVKKFQAQNKLVADGIFGKKSIAMLSGSPVVPVTPGTPTVPVTNGVVSVSLASTNPAPGNLATGTASNPVLAFNLANGMTTPVSITGLNLTKTGYFANTNVSGVAVYDGAGVRHGNVVTTLGASGVANMTFVTDPIVIAAGQSTTVMVKVDISGTNGGIIGFNVNNISDIIGATAMGTFPIVGNQMSVYDGTNSIGAVTLDELPLNAGGVQLNADSTSSQDIAKFRVQSTNSNEDVNLYGLTLWNNGNAAGTDYKDVKLVDQTGNVLATTQSVGQTVTFNLATPYLITKGQTRDFWVKATIINGASRTIQFVVYNNYDLNVKGVSTGAGLLASAGTNDSSFPIGDSTSTYNKVTIASGSMVFSRATDSPATAVTPGANDVVLAKFNAKPVGENMELRGVTFGLDQNTGSTNLTGTVYVKVNGSVVYSAAANTTNFAADGTVAARSLSSYPILTAGVDNTIEVTASISSSATASDAYFVNSFDITSVKRLITNDIEDPSVSPQTGFTRAVQSGSLTTTTLSTPVAASIVPGTNGVPLASFEFNASSSGEDIRVTSVTVTDTVTGGTSTYGGIANLVMKDASGNQLNTSSSTATNANTVAFNFTNPIIVSKTATTSIYLYGDLLNNTNSTTHTYKIASGGVTATGKDTGNTVTSSVAGNGQLMTAVASGKLALSTVSGVGYTPSLAQLGTVNQLDGVYLAGRLTSLYEAQKITSITLKATGTFAVAATALNDIANIRFYAQTGTGALMSSTVPFATTTQFSSCTTTVCTFTKTAADNILPMTVVPVTPVTIFVKADIQGPNNAYLGDSFYMDMVQTPQVSQDVLSGTSGTAAIVINGTTVSVANTGTLSTTVTALKNAVNANTTVNPYVTATESGGTTVILTSTIPGLGFTLTGASTTTTDTISTTTANNGFAAKGAISNTYVLTANSTGSASNSTATTTIVPFQVLATGDSPAAGTTTLSSVGAGTVVGRFKVMNNGSAQVTLTHAKFADSGTHTGTAVRYTVWASSENSSDYTATSLEVSSADEVSNVLDYSTLATPVTINGGSYRYITVTASTVTGVISGDTFNFSIASIGDLKFSVTEANLGYDGDQDGANTSTISSLPVDGKPALGTIQKQ